MISIQINNHQTVINSENELMKALQESEVEKHREISIYGHGEKSLTALINGNHAFLNYIRFEGDSGCFSINSKEENGNYIDFKLSNGQLDEYPENWVIDIDSAYQAIKIYFHTGEKPPEIGWEES